MTSTSVIKDLTILKVIQLDPEATTVVLYPVNTPMSSSLSLDIDSEDCPSLLSALPSDTALPSHTALPTHTDCLRKEQWPKAFQIPLFSYDTECQLQRDNIEFANSQTTLTVGTKMLSDILEKLAEAIYSYKAYPTGSDCKDVADALIRKHPCLTQQGPFGEGCGWQQRIRVKMANYRTILKAHGTSAELSLNSFKSKSREDSYPAKNLKRPRRAEFPTISHPYQMVRHQKAWNWK